ncbi:MAG: hypothetical protein C0443_10965 [Comamonadaceae bacterium]|nr:hypothetical protein [Comamonadaceae bacterium]
MKQSYKTKLAHMLDNGDKLELEAWVDAVSHNEAVELATARFKAVVGELATAGAAIEIDKTKVEMGAHKH